jgi:hypothetical protein
MMTVIKSAVLVIPTVSVVAFLGIMYSIIPQQIHSYDNEPEEKAEEPFEALPSFAPMQNIDDDDAPMMSLTPMDNGVSSSEEKGDRE